jgi:phosphinothricin acetyltransferase
MTARFDMLKAGGFPYVVADAEGAVTGYAYAGPFRTRAAYRFTVEDSIYLATAAQGRGLGRRLLQRLIEESTALGFRQMVAVIGDAAVNTASVRLHAGAGFRNCGRIEGSGFKFGRWCDTHLMQLSLNPGGSRPPARDR